MASVARRLLPAILIVAAHAAAATEREATQIWLNPGMYSHHFRQGDYREDNYGLGAEVVFAPRHRAIAGNFINSNRERSRYAGYHWLPWRWQPGGFDVGAGLILAMIDGYSNTHHGDWFPVVFPSLSERQRTCAAAQAAGLVAAFGVKTTNTLATTMVAARK